MAFHGGMIGVFVTMLTLAHQENTLLTTIRSYLRRRAVGLFFGRIANFINGELYAFTAHRWALSSQWRPCPAPP